MYALWCFLIVISVHIYDVNSSNRDLLIIEQLIRYSQECNVDLNDYTDLDDFIEKNQHSANDAFLQNEEICTALELESTECFEDCIYYLSPLTLITDNTTSPDKIAQVLAWYQFGGGPLGWFDVGNPDMCKYSGGTYCATPIRSNPMGGLSVKLQDHGCCVPASCGTGDDALKVLQANDYCYQSYNQTYAQLMFNGMFEITNNCNPLPRDFSSTGFLSISAVFFIFLIIVIIASVKSQYFFEQQEKAKEISEINKYEYNVRNSWFWDCFSFQQTFKTLITRRPPNKSQFNFFDGIRVISMMWVIWGHLYTAFSTSNPSNSAVMVPNDGSPPYDYIFNKFYMMVAEYSFFAVDSFLFMAGFLSAFSLIRQVEKFGDKAIKLFYAWCPMAYLHRLLRLWPMMVFVYLVQWFIVDQVPYGYNVTSREQNAEVCSADWYKTFLFYANLEDGTSVTCMDHLWYVQVDMQCFLLLPWIILVFQWNKICGLIASLLPFLTCIGVRIFFAIHYRFIANTFLAMRAEFDPSHESYNGGSQMNEYFKPWVRMAPYFMGSFCLMLILIVKEKYKTFVIRSRGIFLMMMFLASFTLSCLVFWPYEDVQDAPQERWSLLSNQIYYALSRPTWAMALMLMSLGLVWKSLWMKSLIGLILSCEIWQPLGKLTYSMYLIHLMVLDSLFYDLNMPTYYEFWWIVCIFGGVWMITFILALILWITIEQPMANLIGVFMKWLSNKMKQKKRERANSKKSEMEIFSKPRNVGNNVVDTLLVDGSYRKTGTYDSFVETHDVVTDTSLTSDSRSHQK